MGLKVRKKKNSSGSVSIHIVDRSDRGYKVVESLGSSKNSIEIEEVYQRALKRMMWLHLFILRIFSNSEIKYQYE